MSIFDGLKTKAGTTMILHFETDRVREELERVKSPEILQDELRRRIEGASGRLYDRGESSQIHLLFNSEGRIIILPDTVFPIWAKKIEPERNWFHLNYPRFAEPTTEEMTRYFNNAIAMHLCLMAESTGQCTYCLKHRCISRHSSFDGSIMDQEIKKLNPI